MIGKNKGLIKLLTNEYPHIMVLHDISHMLNLVAKYALEDLPKGVVELVEEVSSHFNYSCQKRCLLNQIQK